MSAWKVLDEDMRSNSGGHGKWTPGKRRQVRGELIACQNGLHYCRDERDLVKWIGPVICPVTHIGRESIDAGDKGVARTLTIGEPNPYWDERTARHFACDCAEYALQHANGDDRELLQAFIDVSRAYADFGEEWDAARAAARAAACDAARAAAWDSAWDAARAAARAAAWDAARVAACDAARDAAWAAACDAARAAARADVAAILTTYLEGTNEWVIA